MRHLITIFAFVLMSSACAATPHVPATSRVAQAAKAPTPAAATVAALDAVFPQARVPLTLTPSRANWRFSSFVRTVNQGYTFGMTLDGDHESQMQVTLNLPDESDGTIDALTTVTKLHDALTSTDQDEYVADPVVSSNGAHSFRFRDSAEDGKLRGMFYFRDFGSGGDRTILTVQTLWPHQDDTTDAAFAADALKMCESIRAAP